MRNGRMVSLLLIVPMLISPAFGQSASTEIRDITWGATLEAVLRAYPDAQCAAQRAELSDWRCILSNKTLGGINVDIVLYGYSMGTALGLVGVALGFDSTDIHGIVETFVTRYGHWSRTVQREFVTKADKRFSSTIWLWHLPNLEIRVEQDRGTLGHGQATVMWDAGLHELRVRERTWQKQDADGAEGESR